MNLPEDESERQALYKKIRKRAERLTKEERDELLKKALEIMHPNGYEEIHDGVTIRYVSK